MQSNKTVVTISRDEPLQATRTLLLEDSGYSVIALGSDDTVRDFLRLPHQATPDLILMCHSVPEKSRVELCNAIKWRFPSAPILMLYNGYDPTAAKVDGRLENMRDPEALLNTVELLLSTKVEKMVKTAK